MFKSTRNVLYFIEFLFLNRILRKGKDLILYSTKECVPLTICLGGIPTFNYNYYLFL